MNRRNAILTAVGTIAIAHGTSAVSEDGEPSDKRLYKGMASMSVEEFSEGLKKDGYQHRFLGRQICFHCTVNPFNGELDEKALLYVDIEGLSVLPQARLFNLPETIELKNAAGRKVDVHGLILEQNYGIWCVWVYSIRPVSAVDVETGK